MLKKLITLTTLILTFNIKCAIPLAMKSSHNPAWCTGKLARFNGTVVTPYNGTFDTSVVKGSDIFFLAGPHITWQFPYLRGHTTTVFTCLDDITTEFTIESGVTVKIMQDAINILQQYDPQKELYFNKRWTTLRAAWLAAQYRAQDLKKPFAKNSESLKRKRA